MRAPWPRPTRGDPDGDGGLAPTLGTVNQFRRGAGPNPYNLLNFRAAGVPMVARVDPGVRVKLHENIRVAVDPARLHFFDSKTEAAI